MKLLYWANRTLCVIGQPSASLALAALVFVWFKIGYIGLMAVMPSILLLLVAIVYCQFLKRFYRRGAKAVERRRACSGLS
ncbi:hypothetical protein [Pseudomonas fluorescens]|uniref:Uncharacterized protein n=1 Tax=Pseudomonas fluorescens TaxID=294 RepID=A0A5E7N011_PSEFL|nr:hypothetical protein [Pseudomonas fluorescens]VVP30478.1 hypothetical protein PS880_04311 [Pseudomonas fluorescens]